MRRGLLLLLSLLVCCHLMAQRRLTSYLSSAGEQGLRPAVIVCPGGSYSWLDMQTEGHHVAQWLQQEGISAFVLRYRVQGGFAFATGIRHLIRGHHYPDALHDLQSAILHVRRHARELGIDPDRLGVMGFSAGGHLVASSACYCPADSMRPDFVASIYPVVTFSREPYVHHRSRRALLGEYRRWSRTFRDSLSLEHHIPGSSQCPPFFVVNCKDDPVVHYRNSELLDSALTAQSVPHRYIQYETGGHGFGGDTLKASTECIQWKEEFLKFLTSLNYKL